MAWYTIKAKADIKAAAEIYIYGDIGESWWEESVSAADFVRDLNALKNDEVIIRINSVGGSVPDGLAIYNAIQRHPSNITIHIDGMAASIASLIALAAENTMAENGIMMIHAPMSVAVGNASQMRVRADELDKWAEAMAVSYARKTGKTTEEVMAWLDGQDHYFTAAEAQAAGLVDSITEAVPIAASLRIPAASLSRFKGAPDSANQFVIKAAKPAQPIEDHDMDREEKIRAKFKAHLSKPGVQALLDTVLADEAITVESAEAQLAEVLAKHPAPTNPAPEAVLAQEKTRRESIRAKFQPFEGRDGVQALLNECLDDHQVSVEAAGDRLLAKLGENCEPVAGSVVVRDNPERARFNDGVVACLLSRAGKADAKTREAANATGQMNLSLMEQAKAALTRAGIDFSHMNSQQIAVAALTQSTSDFPVLLENAMHKALLSGYSSVPDTWSRFCSVGSVSDFRAHGRYRTGSIGNYQTVNENGEYTNATIPDGEKQTITAVDRGLIINLTYQMIINDDLGAFIGLASDLGRAGRRTVEASVYSLLAENSGLGPSMSDGNPLFHARTGANNIGTGAALSMASIDADRVVMASQTDVSGNDFLDLRPAVWLGPVAHGGTARSINEAQYDPDTANKLQKPNTVRGLFRDIVDTARLSGTRYYLFADPNEVPVIEVAFLNGESEPYIMMEESFSTRGNKYRATLDFGVAAVGYRGAVTNAGTT